MEVCFGGRSLRFFEASEASKVCQREGAEGLNSFFGRQPDRWDAPNNQTMQDPSDDDKLRMGSMIQVLLLLLVTKPLRG